MDQRHAFLEALQVAMHVGYGHVASGEEGTGEVRAAARVCSHEEVVLVQRLTS